MLYVGEQPWAAVEVFVSSAVDAQKAADLQGTDWCEVEARDIVENPRHLPARRHALDRFLVKTCEACIKQQIERNEAWIARSRAPFRDPPKARRDYVPANGASRSALCDAVDSLYMRDGAWRWDRPLWHYNADAAILAGKLGVQMKAHSSFVPFCIRTCAFGHPTPAFAWKTPFEKWTIASRDLLLPGGRPPFIKELPVSIHGGVRAAAPRNEPRTRPPPSLYVWVDTTACLVCGGPVFP